MTTMCVGLACLCFKPDPNCLGWQKGPLPATWGVLCARCQTYLREQLAQCIQSSVRSRAIVPAVWGLADLFPLVRKIYPLDLIDDMPTKASPCLACGWRSSLDGIGYHRGRVCSCLNSYCVYANMKAIGNRVDCLRLRR